MKPVIIGVVAGLALGYLVGYNKLYVAQHNRVLLIRQQVAQELSNQQARKDAANLIHQVEEYQAQLPSEPDPSWLVHQAMAAGQKAGVDIVSISQQSPEKSEQATTLSVILQINGTYHQLGRFLDELEHAKHFIRVNQVSVISSRGDNEKPAIQVTLSTLYLSAVLTQAKAATKGR